MISLRLIPIFLLLSGLPSICEGGNRSDFDLALVAAAQGGEWDLVQKLLEHEANPNAMVKNRHSVLVYACLQSQYSGDFSARMINYIKLLPSRGANENLADSFGTTPLLAADRADAGEIVGLLKEHGAKAFRIEDPRVRAAATLVDAEILLGFLTQLCIEDVRKFDQLALPYGEIEKYTEYSRAKVAQAHGKDLFGRPFILNTEKNPTVLLSNDSLIWFCQRDIPADYWKPIGAQIGTCHAETKTP